MRISVDISLYPLNKEYEGPIKGFISKVKAIDSLDVNVNPMSTQIRGEHEVIFDLFKEEIPNVFEENRAAFIIKVIKGND